MARHWMATVLVGLAAAGLAAGCNDNEVTALPADGGAGLGGTGGSGGAGSGGSAGTDGGGGTAGTGGSAGLDGGAGSGGGVGVDGGDAGPPPGTNPVGVVVVPGAQTDGGSKTPRLLVAGTDFATTTEIASVDVAAKTVTGRLSVNDGDAVPEASGGLGFVLERTNGRVDLLAPDGTLDKAFDVAQTGSGSAIATTRAYVPLYDDNRVAVLDLGAGIVSHSLDLSGYLDASDGDGSVDADNAVYDAQSGRLYLTLQRIDRTTIVAPSYQLACPTVPSLLIAFDTTTDTEVDLNGSATGKAIALATVNPDSAVLDQGKLVILSAGCFDTSDGGATRVKQGIESIDPSTGQSSVLYQPTNDDFLARMLPVGAGQTLVDRFDSNFVEHWNRYQIGASTLGSELVGWPDGVSYDGSGGLFGVATTSGDGGSNVAVVRYNLTTGTATTLLSSPWQGPVSSAAGTALVE